MIKLLDSNFKRIGNLKNVLDAERSEEINSVNTLKFKLISTTSLLSQIQNDSIFELDDDYFDLVYVEKQARNDGTYIINVESEHISYRLNNQEYNVEYFTEYGTPEYILGKILDGTDFIVGDVEFSDVVTYSAQEAKSRRQLLMEFAAYIKGELYFHKNEIGIVQHRGSSDVKILTKGKNINVVGSIVDKRERDSEGNPLLSYYCEPIALPGVEYSLGDDILLIQPELNIREKLRLIKMSYNPYKPYSLSMEFSNKVPGLEDQLFRIETEKISKDKKMNGIRIGPVYGFEAVRNDKMARAYFRSDRMAFQSGDGSGENWVDRLYYDYDSDLGETVLIFDGKFSVNALNAIKADIDFIINNTFITQNLYAEYGRIAKLSVSELDTSWKKITNYLINDTSDVNYIRIHEKYMDWITASTNGEDEEQVTDIDGNPLFWRDATKTGMTLTDTGYPVLIYKYVESTKFQMTFEDEEPHAVKMTFGQGYGYENPNAGRGVMYKDADGLKIQYTQASGNLIEIKLGEDGIIQCGNSGIYGLRNIAVSSTPPSNPEINDLWIRETLKRWDGIEWVNVVTEFSPITYNTTISTTWIGSSAPYYQNISIPGLITTDNPIVDIILTGVYADDMKVIEEWNNIYRIIVEDNNIKVYSTDITTIPINIQIKAV